MPGPGARRWWRAPAVRLLATIAALREGGTGMAAACSGTFFLAKPWILDGLTATTSGWLGPTFRDRYRATVRRR